MTQITYDAAFDECSNDECKPCFRNTEMNAAVKHLKRPLARKTAHLVHPMYNYLCRNIDLALPLLLDGGASIKYVCTEGEGGVKEMTNFCAQ